MKLPIFQIDAFAEKVFSGNPAAVCPLDSWISDAMMQAIAAENNLAETAFFLREGNDYALRWFTPMFEIDLCGHATLASAYVLFEHMDYQETEIIFHTKSGPLKVWKENGQLAMDFPARPPQPISKAPEALLRGLNLTVDPVFIGKSRDYFVQVASEKEVEECVPQMDLIAELDAVGVILTARSDQPKIDFVSRFFAPQAGVPEDPVTGSAHSTLIPYWAEKLGKSKLEAHQISPRGGKLSCESRDNRVTIAGVAKTYLKGEIFLPD